MVKASCGRPSKKAEFILKGHKSQSISKKSRDKVGVSISRSVRINLKCLKENWLELC